MIDAAMMEHWGFLRARDVPGRGDCVVERFIFTCGLLVSVKVSLYDSEYAARYCYDSMRDALEALDTWDGKGDPPGPWIKEKVSERLGPGARVTDEQRARHALILELRRRRRAGP